MQIRCLGALEALHDGRTLALGGPKQRLVLAHLLIRANTVVPADRLVDEVWDRRPPPAVPEVTRLTELRAAAIEDRIAAEFALGRDRELVAELEALTAEHPLRERLWAQLMTAQYHAGRQGEALGAYARARRALADELGIDPSPDLQALHGRILRQDPSLRPGTTPLRGYTLIERLDVAGTIWRATQPGVQREVAVRLIPPRTANDAAFIRRFEIDAQAVARVEHPHVVPLYDFWREPDGAYLVTRLLPGPDLATLLATEGPPPAADGLRMARQISEGLAAAHRLGVVHGDLTASHVLLDDGGNAFVTDFAIGRDLGPDDGDQASSGPTSPGRRARLQRDVAALGTVLERLLANAGDDPRAAVRRATRDGRTAGAVAGALRTAEEEHRPTTARTPATERGPPATRNPYKGLQPFLETDAADFHGRETLVARLVTRLREEGPHSRFLAVVGASGSGKSSVVRAGLVPAVRRGALAGSASWFVAQMVPGPAPFRELMTALRRIAVSPLDASDDAAEDVDLRTVVPRILPGADGELLLVVDQFEELFTQVDDARRDRFLDRLVAATTAPASQLRVVVTLRADFYDRPLAHRGLAELVRTRTEVVVPLSATELSRAIVAPAARVGIDVEAALVAQMVSDVADQPAALPLLQYALTEVFDRRDGDTLTIAAYREVGGSAVPSHAAPSRSWHR